MLKQKKNICAKYLLKNIKQKKNICAKYLLKNIKQKKKLWTFEWLKMSHIFISPYHNYFWVDFKKKLTCTLKNCLE
jgi:hypothetical protein